MYVYIFSEMEFFFFFFFTLVVGIISVTNWVHAVAAHHTRKSPIVRKRWQGM